MTDYRAVLQQALEALELLDAPPSGVVDHYELERRKQAIRAALAEHPQQSVFTPKLTSPACWCMDCDLKANGGLRSRMSLCPECGDKRCPRATNHQMYCANMAKEPQQEPVAWMRTNEDCTDCITWHRTDDNTIPLYTTPQDGISLQSLSHLPDDVNAESVETVEIEVPEPQQEPVAWRHLHEDGWEYYDAPTGSDCDKCQPLYTAPPRQEDAVREAYERGTIDGFSKAAESRVTRFMDQASRKPLPEEMIFQIADALDLQPNMTRAERLVWFAREVERAHNVGAKP